MKQIKVPTGFTESVVSDSKPCICVYGEMNTGTTRFGCTVPHDEGWIGWLAIDKNSKITVEKHKREWKLPILVNDKPFLTHQEAIRMALEEDAGKVKEVYKAVLDRVFEAATKLAGNPDIESIVLDRGSQIYDYGLFSHFGRRNQIEAFTRGVANQDFIDLINALSVKNLCVVCKASEIWKDTGRVDKKGQKVQEPSGRFKPDGFNRIGEFCTATIELTAERKKIVVESTEDEAVDVRERLKQKYKCKVVTCKGNTLLEGQVMTEYGVAGEDITWDNVMQVIGVA